MWVAVALGIFFRLWHLDKKLYSDDEVHTSLWISGHSKDELRKAFADREVAIHELRAFQRVNPNRGVLRTLAVLAEGDPQHPPLYYLLVRIWAQFFGDSVWVIRSLSVLASLLVMPCVYWLCVQLFERQDVARLATALVALSPFHVLYGQEAREYSLWTVTILLSSIAVLRASKEQTRSAWTLYFVAVVLGLYTHTLFSLVMLAHAAYIVVHCRQQRRSSQGHIPMCSLGYVAASIAGVIAWGPWLNVLATNLSKDNFAASSWGGTAVEPWRLVAMWGFNFSTVFFDANKSIKFVERLDTGALSSYGIQMLTLIVAGYAIYHLYRRAFWQPRVFLLSMIVVPVVVLVLPDLILGGIRSGGGNRYFVPSYLGIEIAVAVLLVAQVTGEDPLRRRIWSVAASALLTAGVISCMLVSRAETWWIKSTSYYTPRMARVINSAERPLLIIGVSPLLLSFSHRLDEKVRLWVVGDPRALRIPPGVCSIFVYDPSELLVKTLVEKRRTLEAVDVRSRLYRLSTARQEASFCSKRLEGAVDGDGVPAREGLERYP
jgi:uncharacterized membrane protein